MDGPRATVLQRRRLLAAVILAAVLGGCGSTAPASPSVGPTPSVSDDAAATTPAPTPSEETAVAPPGKAAFSPITLKGKGKKVAKFKIPGDAAALAQATYSGSNAFTVTSLAADGGQNDLLVDTTGKYTGTVLFDAGIDQHSVAFRIVATGSWAIVVKPVAGARTWDGSGTLKGSGDDVVQISPASSGTVSLDLSFKGKDAFTMTSYSVDGGDVLANDTGNFSGHVVLPDGSFLLAVRADGDTWSAKAG
jgi:hypothetical protein